MCISSIPAHIKVTHRSIADLPNISRFVESDFSKNFFRDDECKLKTKISEHKVYKRESTEESSAITREEEDEEGKQRREMWKGL